ncbi:hypothetical protein JCM14076_19050 [Methylosoma difficile]
MNTTTFSIAQLQQLSKEGYLGTWRFERWLNVISAVEGFLPKLHNGCNFNDRDKAQEFNTYCDLHNLIFEACDTGNIWEGLKDAYGCEAKADLTNHWWVELLVVSILNSEVKGLIEGLIEDAIDESAHFGWGNFEARVSEIVEEYYDGEDCIEAEAA